MPRLAPDLQGYGGQVQAPADLRIAAAVAAGGVLGSAARWALVAAVPWHPPSVPTATLVVNLVGCLLIGVLLTWWTEGSPPAWWVRPFAAVGFVGGFTTFSTFAVEGVRLVDAGAVGTAAAYTVGSVVLGLLLVHIGSYGARRALGETSGGM
jgi:CrcB protein